MPRLPQTEAEKQYKCLLEKLDGYCAARKREGWDAEKTARSLGYQTRQTLWKRQKSPQNISLSELQAIANTLNVTIPTLLGYKN